jgi:single-stranded DNA-binding protein
VNRRELVPPMINNVVVSGVVSKRKGLTRTSSGRYLLSFEISNALETPGEAGEKTSLLDVEVWGEEAEALDRSLEPEMSVLVEGRLASFLFEDRSGTARHRMVVRARTVQLLDPGN